jgi:A1 cistron-splicing factor AAR2
MSIDKLTQEQAQALFEAGGFVIISDLPQGSEFGIDGT